MGKNLEPKCKQCRRAGEKLMLKGERCNTAKCGMTKRNYPPGVHGNKGRKRLTDYGTLLQEKQKAKKIYNLLEKQFKLTFDMAEKLSGNTGHNLLILLEMRFDNVIYRLGLASSRNQARHLINHGHFTIDDKKVDIPSYRVKKGEIIRVKKSRKDNKYFRNIKEKLKNSQVPGWLHFDNNEMEGKVLHNPTANMLQANIDTQMVVEFYSK
jgi:small subunit ribosomal protein S4